MNPVTAVPAAVAELAAIVGEAHCVVDPVHLAAFAIDAIVPASAVSPASAEEVAAVLRVANERGWVVSPAGGMTQQTMGATPERVDVVLRTDRLTQLLHYDPADLTLGAAAGMTLAQVDALLAEHRQMLPFDPPQPARSTIGGIMATGVQGPLHHSFGGVRDYCIGVRFVTGDGKISKAGGRVVKNVAGYDLMKLLIGSHGTLGVIVSANFKVVPRPRQTRTFICDFDSSTDALRFRDSVVASPLTPMCLEICSPHAHEYCAPAAAPRDPEDVAGTLQADLHKWSVLVRASGSDAVLDRYRRELGSAIAREAAQDAETRLWEQVCEFTSAVAERHRNAMIAHITSPIQGVGAALAAFEKAALDSNFLPAAIGRCGVGALVAAFVPLAVDPPSAVNYAAAVSALRAALPRGATAVVTRCPVEAKKHFDVWGGEGVIGAMHRVRHAMDPRGVLNEGRFVV